MPHLRKQRGKLAGSTCRRSFPVYLLAYSAMSDTSATNPAAVTLPSAGIRGLVSYLIFLHFFFLLVGIKSSTSSSGLDQDLRNKVPGLRSYLQLLGMDLSYMFHLTHYDGLDNLQDTDHFVEAEIRQADGTTKTVVFGQGMFPGVRARRFERLAFVASYSAEIGNENNVSLLTQAIARRIMLEEGTRDLTIKLRRRLPQNLMLKIDTPEGKLAHSRSPDDPVYFPTIYEARAFMNEEGEVSVAQIKAAYDTAAPQGTTPQPGASPTGTAAPPNATPTGTAPAAVPSATKAGLLSGPSFPSVPVPTTLPTSTLPTATPSPTAVGTPTGGVK